MQHRAGGFDEQAVVTDNSGAVDDQRVTAGRAGWPDQRDGRVRGCVAARAVSHPADVQCAGGQRRVDRHRVRAEVVADRDEVGEREIAQRIGQCVEIHLDAHEARVRR